MPALIQICIVIVTVGLLAIALMTVRMMNRFNRATEELSQVTHAVRESVVQFDLVTLETRALVASIHGCVPPVQRALDRVDAVSQRAADLTSTILDELETPAFVAVAVVRGVRTGANTFLKRMVNRLIHRDSSMNGGYDSE